MSDPVLAGLSVLALVIVLVILFWPGDDDANG